MYVVEVRHDGNGLAEPMAQMRNWLDREGIQPSVFQLFLVAGGTVFRLEFTAAGEAEAFARAFSGQIIRSEATGAVAA